MRIIDVFKNITEEERRKAVTEILIEIENKQSKSFSLINKKYVIASG